MPALSPAAFNDIAAHGFWHAFSERVLVRVCLPLSDRYGNGNNGAKAFSTTKQTQVSGSEAEFDLRMSVTLPPGFRLPFGYIQDKNEERILQ
ncbi:hypothetical protein ABID22_002209 [Pontibacter aydingkolensis]|uniref:Uncharacterized protein n=1 Tax=Pontibacter aydingkolensis TaxID=1911536 RepID=A0ABS7CVF1_9BACT|nr:hypothetical protein [Pontibacter aydingkolensis]MBW7467815.1 hypothetical protein [Pontibacter aydingkolensis]